jgi:hypothetical protein
MNLLLPLALAVSAATFGADATGAWTGELTRDDGQPGPAHLVLKQEGSRLTGTGGPNADEQYAIRNGSVSPDGELSFEIANENSVMKFKLRLSGDEIKGDVTRQRDGQAQTAKLSVRRANFAGGGAPAVDLKTRLAALDKELFDSYNACDLKKFEALVDGTNIEFYHDNGGLMSSLAPILEATKKNVCGKVRRELVSMEVYPVPGYGAIQAGLHKFYNRSSGEEETGPPAKFLHIWHEGKDGQWKLTRVVSYDHH